MKRKKLLILINNLNFFCTHRLSIAKAAKKNGFNVIIGYGENDTANAKLLKQKGFVTSFIPMERGKFSFFKDLKNFFLMWSFFKREKPDVAHLVTIKPYLYGGIISRLTGVPGVVSAVSGLGTLFIHNDLKSRFFRFLLYPLYCWAFNHINQKIIFQNNDDARVFRNYGVVNSSKIKLIRGSGVKLENFFNFIQPKGIPVVCFASRLIRDKGVFEYIAAAKILKEKKVKAIFLLAGAQDFKNPSGISTIDLNKIKQEKYVKVIGHINDIPSLYASSNIICLPSYREGLPKALVEAAAAGRAVVTTNVPGCRDAIIPNKTGLLVPAKNAKKLANAIERLVKNRAMCAKMGKEGRKFAKKNFDIDKIVKSHLDVYKELICK